MKTPLLAGLVLLAGCGSTPADTANHQVNVACARVECVGEASAVAFFALNSDTAGTPKRADYITCTWDDGYIVEYASLDAGCYAQSYP